ncbi:MAG: hypothetical protein IJ849_11920 [Selenomonadaceae bacterium]|nr:hypothetical protein [Selenomonadaceae bacterium]
MDNERLAWSEIVKKYPDKWVGMSQIEWKNDANVRSAVVIGASDDGEEFMFRACDGEDVCAMYTTPNNLY